MSTALLRRRGAARVTGVLAASAFACVGAVASTTAASAEESITDTLQNFAPDAFASQADELPTGLVEAIQRDLGISAAEFLANGAAAKVAADVSAELEADGVNINATVIDGQEVTLYVEAEADAEAAAEVGAEVEIGVPELLDISDHEFEAKVDHKGGYGFFTAETETQGFRCSVGFSGFAQDGADRFLTAGHCGLDTNHEQLPGPVFHLPLDEPITDPEAPLEVGDEIGQIVDGSMSFGPDSPNNDGGLIDLTNPAWDGVPQVAGWAGSDGNPDEDTVTIFDSVDAVVGAQACKSGSTSGWTCGVISDAEETVPIGDEDDEPVTVTGFIFDACMLSGDSGGSIVVGNFALGVNSASSFDECSDDGLSVGYAVSGGEFNAMDLFGADWELNVEVSTPTVTSPEDGGESGPAVTVEGNVANAGANHRVTVSVDDGEAVEGSVDAEGNFSVPLEGDLEPGEHTLAVQAFFGNNSESDVAESAFTVTEAEPVEELAVESPTDGQTTGNARPTFNGTGQPGATVSLAVDGTALGETEVGEDGTWSITPSADLPVGVRFDATVSQVFEDDTQEVTVTDLGINAPAVTITAPEDGSTVAGDVAFEGTSFPGATVSLLLEPAGADDADAADARMQARADGDDAEDAEVWEGEFEIGDDGNWTFTPAEALEDGDYTVTAMATLEGGDPELSNSEAAVSFTVSTGGGGEDDDDLPDTGSSNMWMIFLGIGLLAAGGAAVAIRARRNSTTA